MTHPLASREYADALAGSDAAIAVPAWRSHVIRRAIGPDAHDALGVYPLAVFARDRDIRGGLDQLRREGLVSLVLVPDPLLHGAGDLARDFDICRPFKTHLLIDTACGPFAPDKHHRDRIRRAHRRCGTEIVALIEHLDEWRRLYAGLAARRGINGMAAFSDNYFETLARMPAITAFAARVDGVCAAMTLWFAADGVVYNHLTAVNALGYANGASYALYDAAIAHFAGQGVVNLGGGAGISDADDGLAAFKRGFANSQVVAHVCGAVLDPQGYQRLSAGRPATTFFPAYRAPDTAARAA